MREQGAPRGDVLSPDARPGSFSGLPIDQRGPPITPSSPISVRPQWGEFHPGSSANAARTRWDFHPPWNTTGVRPAAASTRAFDPDEDADIRRPLAFRSPRATASGGRPVPPDAAPCPAPRAGGFHSSHNPPPDTDPAPRAAPRQPFTSEPTPDAMGGAPPASALERLLAEDIADLPGPPQFPPALASRLDQNGASFSEGAGPASDAGVTADLVRKRFLETPWDALLRRVSGRPVAWRFTHNPPPTSFRGDILGDITAISAELLNSKLKPGLSRGQRFAVPSKYNHYHFYTLSDLTPINF